MVGKLNVVSLLSWAILVVAIVASFRPLIPVIWDDCQLNVESALLTLEAGRPTVVGGRDPGYPIFLAMTFAVGGDLGSVVLFQQTAWAALMLALAATAQKVTRSAYSLGPIILLAMYPGLLHFRNIIAPETFYTVFLNLAVLGLLLATNVKNAIRCWLVAAAIIMAALAACFKLRGILVPIAVTSLGVWITWPYTPRRFAVIVLACTTALALIATGSRFGAYPSDKYSVVVGSKTLFCNHINIVLASEAARREIAIAAGDHTDAMFARLIADRDSKRQTWPTLGFYGDECLVDTILDQYLTKDDSTSSNELADSYRRIFLAAILDRPLLYLGKVIHQMYYGVLFSWPPYALMPTFAGLPNITAQLLEIMKEHGQPAHAIEVQPIGGWILSDLGRPAVLLFRGLSAAFAAAVLFWILTTVRGRRPEFSVRAGIVIVLWAASILPTAAAHTLDIWAYLAPATPMVSLLLSMVCAELAVTVVTYRRGRPAA